MNKSFNFRIYEQRRKKLSQKLANNSLLIVPNSNHSIRSNDVEYRFKADPDFQYLSGFEEPSSILVLKKEKNNTKFILYVPPKDKDKEIWTGKRHGTEGAKSIFKAHQAFDISTFYKEFHNLIQNTNTIYYPIGRFKDLDLKITSLINNQKNLNRSGANSLNSISDSRDLIHEMRLIKDSHEISLMQKAADISRLAHIDAMKFAKPGMYEYELDAIIESRFRKEGSAGPSYPTIAGSGENCTILHYIENNKLIRKDQLILIDAGCEYENYASDLTRTFPSGKKFTSPQKDLYEIVLSAQNSAIKQSKPGKTFDSVHQKALRTIIEGLKELKLLKGSYEKIVKSGEYRKFYMHKTGHWLGLDVHDAGRYFDENKKSIKLQAGMVTTVEPGIYISRDLNVPKHFRGIGIRIEDDVLITKSGNKVLTAGTPKTVKEIEAIRENNF